MNVTLWVLQGLLAIHTFAGAVWKFSHSPRETMPSLAAIPAGAWIAMSAVEILCALALVVPAFQRRLVGLIPLAAAFLVAEMLLYSGLHLAAGQKDMGPIAYWLVVAALAAVVGLGRRAVRA